MFSASQAPAPSTAVAATIAAERAELGMVMTSHWIFPRIEEQHAGSVEVRCVAGHNMKTMPPGCGGDQAVGTGDGLAGFLGNGGKFSPDAAGFKIDGEEPVGVMAFQGLKPRL